MKSSVSGCQNGNDVGKEFKMLVYTASENGTKLITETKATLFGTRPISEDMHGPEGENSSCSVCIIDPVMCRLHQESNTDTLMTAHQNMTSGSREMNPG